MTELLNRMKIKGKMCCLISSYGSIYLIESALMYCKYTEHKSNQTLEMANVEFLMTENNFLEKMSIFCYCFHYMAPLWLFLWFLWLNDQHDFSYKPLSHGYAKGVNDLIYGQFHEIYLPGNAQLHYGLTIEYTRIANILLYFVSLCSHFHYLNQ